MVVVLVGGSNGNHVMAADLGRRPEFEVQQDNRVLVAYNSAMRTFM